MIAQWLNKLVPSRNQRLLRSWQPMVQAINDLEPQMRDQTNAQFLTCFDQWRQEISNGASVDDLLIPVFAATREVARRRVDMRHFDSQLLGGIALHNGKIGEMATGEGKTLVATLAATLNALNGGTHVVTVNDYLAQRDCEWMGEVYRGLGLKVAAIFSEMKSPVRRQAYQAEISYGTNSEFGFDFLRDNMCLRSEDKVQRKLTFAIVDEVDSILIDEARTPLIISGIVDDDLSRYVEVDRIVTRLQPVTPENEEGDFTLDEKSKRAHLGEQGQENAENLLIEAGLIKGSLYDPSNSLWLHHLDAALRARHLYHKDIDYVVRDQKIHIVDVFTGRVMPGRRWSQGLHQALEAKERVPMQPESQTLASITLQNYFRMYDKICGMTGTASTEAPEFMQIYGVEVVSIPPNRPNIRLDYPDRVYLTLEEKYDAITDEIQECHQLGRPVLVGTTSIENSELISTRLKKLAIKHMVLNAKQHDKESYIVANAGNLEAVTIATNMAGRGTDIVLGGNLTERLKSAEEGDENALSAIKAQWRKDHQQVVELGGLHIVGSERHEARRIDNQLRGRCARQGDPGSTRFYLSLEDNLMRIFASDTVSRLMQRLGLGGGEAIEHGLLTRAIVNAQRKVEVHNFEIRKNLLDYDNVVNQQRRFIYEQREKIMVCTDPPALMQDLLAETVKNLIETHLLSQDVASLAHVQALADDLAERFYLETEATTLMGEDADTIQMATISANINQLMQERWSANLARLGETLAPKLILEVMLQNLDRNWREHLSNIDYIKQGIHLRSYAQKQPIQEFKREAFNVFFAMTTRYRDDVCAFLLRPIARVHEPENLAPADKAPARQIRSHHDSPSNFSDPAEQWLDAVGDQGASGDALPSPTPAAPAGASAPRKMGRNERCYCGSGKKFKHCHGR